MGTKTEYALWDVQSLWNDADHLATLAKVAEVALRNGNVERALQVLRVAKDRGYDGNHFGYLLDDALRYTEEATR